jgi:peptidyl-prolyl cis-trans isomerase SurA
VISSLLPLLLLLAAPTAPAAPTVAQTAPTVAPAASPVPPPPPAVTEPAPPPPAAAPAPAALPPAAVPAPAPAAAPAAPRAVVNRVVAVVNGEVITLQELQDRAGEDYRQGAAMPAGPGREAAVRGALKRALDAMIADKLIHGQVANLQAEATDEQVTAAIEDIKKRNRADDKTLDQMLAEQGLTRAAFREQIKGQLESYNVLTYKLRGKVRTSDEDLKNYYQSHPAEFTGEEELHVRHIFLPLAEDAPAAEVAKVQAGGEKALQRLAAGEPFDKVARDTSKGPGAADGGDLGWLRRGTIQKSLEDIAFALRDGETSRLVRSGPGLHIFKVEERRMGGSKTFDQAKDEIRDRLSVEQAQGYREQFVAELKRDAVIDILMPELQN